MPTPRTPAPALTVPLVGADTFDLAAEKPDRFSLVAFYRGYHCPVCKKQLTELDQRLDELAEVGITSVVAVSGDTRDRAEKTVEEWGLERLRVGYDVDAEVMRDWGLFLSKAVKDGEPDLFSEPALFLVEPDGTLYAAVVQSMPFARPRLDDLLKGVKFINDNDYPARGEAG